MAARKGPYRSRIQKGIYYFPSYEVARAYAQNNGHPTDRIIPYKIGWAIQLRKSGPYVGPEEKNVAYSPKTGARCTCRPGVQRDNCPRCEGTGWVIDFKKIHERREKNPARWAHGTMSYRQPPGSVSPMVNPRGGQFYLNARFCPICRARPHLMGCPRRKRMRYRNPGFRRNPGKGGGTNWLLIGGIAVGAFFLLRPGVGGTSPLTSLFGGGTAAVPPGYTPIGSGLYRSPTGQIVARNPQTGQMVMAPYGSQPTSVEDLLTRAGISLIPSVANNLASWVSSMFSTQQTSTGAVIPAGATPGTPTGEYGPFLPPLAPLPDQGGYTEWGGVAPSSEDLFAQELAPLAPLPTYTEWGGVAPSSEDLFAQELPPLNELPTYPVYDWNMDWGSYEQGGYELPGLPPIDYDVMIGVGSGEVTIANPDEWYGFFGLDGHRGGARPGYMGAPPVY